jgi:peptide/nickel transport system permease protein
MGLRSYVITRILLTIPTLLLLLSMVFIVMRVLPGDPVALHFEKKGDPEQMEIMRRILGLDKPLLAQFADYIWGLVDINYFLAHGYPNFGKSMQTYEEVGGQIFSAFPATLELAIYSMTVACLIGILLGVAASKSYNSIPDHLIRGFGTVTYAVPVFFLGIILQLIFGVYLHWLPTGLRINPSVSPPATITGLYTIDSLLEGDILKFVESVKALLLPSLTLGIILSGVFVRLTRTNMLETLRLDFVTAAKARGLSDITVTYGYALRNAFLPILTMMGLQFAMLLGGAILTETTFSWPGLGRYIVNRINFRDYTAIQGAVVMFGLFVALVSLVVDIFYAYLDPRIRL